MREFCGSDFWNESITWESNSPDFTPCFEKSVFVAVPCIFLWIFAIFEWQRIGRSRNRNIPWSWVNISKIVLSLLLIGIQLGILITNISLNSDADVTIYGVDFFYPSLIAVSLALQLIFILLEKRNGIQRSGYLFAFWLLMLICGIASFRTSILMFQNEDEIEKAKKAAALYCLINYPFVVIMFLANCFGDKPPQIEAYPRGPNYNKELDASFLNLLTFTWLDNIIWTGFKTPLKMEHLPDLPPRNVTKVILDDWDKHWKHFIKNYDWRKKDSNEEKKKFSILPVILKTFWKPLLAGAILKLIPDLLMFVSPQIIRLLIDYSTPPLTIYEWQGYFFAAILFLITELQSILNAQQFMIMYDAGLRIRATITSTVFEKALRISSSSKKESTVGEIVNLMAVDVQRFLDLMGFINYMWSAPMQIILCVFFLWRELGPSAMVALLVMVVLIPINGFLASRQKIYQIIQMKEKDKRVKLINEILNGIKVLKLYAWEPSFTDYIKDIRRKEVKVLKKNAYIGAVSSLFFTSTPFMVAFFMFMTYVLVSPDNVLRPDIVFVSLSLLNILRMPMTFLPIIIITMVQASVSLKRMNHFLRSEELDPSTVEKSEVEDDPIIIENGTFSWGHGEDDKPILKNINIRVKEGSLVGVVGTVGSGKSSLCLSILGEMEKDEGRVYVNKSIAYVPQQAWMQNASVKNNILFGKKFNNVHYKKTLQTCALQPDLEMLADGDQTEIGEKGINLSGGQKQRINLARACYSDSEVYLLDDPLSAVDSHVGKHIFEQVIGPTGILKNKTRILVTHGLGYLKNMDEIIVLKDGEIVERGSLTNLIAQKGDFQEFLLQYLNENDVEDEELELEVLEEIKKTYKDNSAFQRQFSRESRLSTASQGKYSQSSSLSRRRGSALNQSLKKKMEPKEVLSDKGKIIIDEKTGSGGISLSVYTYYAAAIGIISTIITIVFYGFSQTFSVLSNILLSDWSENEHGQEVATRNKYLGIYGSFGVGQALSVVVAYTVLARATIVGSRKLHNEMLHNVLRSPMAFFDVTPIGRIVNRFSKDVDIIDVLLPMNIRSFLMLIMGVLATFGAIIYATPIFAAVVVPALIVYFCIQKVYVTTSRQLKRIESVTRSPIYTHFGESIQGATTIRAYKKQEDFVLQIQNYVDVNHQSYYIVISSYRWLSIRLEFIGNCLIFFAALFTVLSRNTISPGNVGLSLSYSLSVTGILNYLVRVTADVETNIVSVERVKEYTELKNEANWENKEKKPDEKWPANGEVTFKNYSARYREGLDLVIKNINCEIKSQEKIGIVGRTGAGKSSLTLALFRIVEPANGTIIIDGIDIANIGLHDLRGRLTIIPQDPVLFSGTLRLNLDPFEKYEDSSLWSALEHSHLKDFVSGLPSKLNHEVAEGGENLSVGQRQLVCLARALLRKSKVLVLDEATAAVDMETDSLIQDTIRKEFADSTVITIAHRLNTIMDSTRIMVLDKGEIKEFDSPGTLLANKASFFYDLVKSAGLITDKTT